MSSVNLGRFSRAIEKFFNIKGGGTLLDIEPNISVEYSIQSGNEDRYLFTWNRFAVNFQTGAAAASNAGVQFRNPVGSNTIAIIERLGFEIAVATLSPVFISYATNSADLTNAATPQRLDERQQGGSPMIVSGTSNTGNLTNILMSAVLNGLETQVIATQNQEFTILPGASLRVVDQTQNEAIRVNILWRERALEASELAG